MQLTLPKSDLEYKTILKELWNIDIYKDELIGEYSPSQDGKLGFFNNCTTIDGIALKYPEQSRPLNILIRANSIENLIPKARYKFKVQFGSIPKRLEINPFLLVTKRDSIIKLENQVTSIEQRTENPKVELSNNKDLRSIIEEIYNEKLNQNNPYNIIDIAEAVESLATDIYSENKRFIYELIQNADDAAMEALSELVIDIKAGFVILSHNGKPFDERDLRGLCGIGRGTKRDDEAKTGYKGIGFKSVFGQRDGLVYVKTNKLLFRFDRNYIQKRGWNTRWGNKEEWERLNRTTFKSPWQLIPILSSTSNNGEVDQILNSSEYTVKTAIKIQNEADLACDIKELFADARFLLFLRKIYKVSFKYGSDILCIEKESHVNNSNILSLYKNKSNVSNWYVRSGNHKIPAEIKKELESDHKSPKKLQEITQTELTFAFKLDRSLNSIQLLANRESCIFTYLPTSVTEFGFPFLINSNFLVDAGREKLHKDRIWNKWLFKEIGYEIIKCCAEFANSTGFKDEFCKILLNDYLSETDQLKICFNKGLKLALENIPFIPNRNNHLVKLSEVVIDEVGILNKDIIDLETISLFINSDPKFSPVLTDNILTAFIGFEKLKFYGAKIFSIQELKDFLQSSIFLENHKIAKNYNLLNFLKQLDEGDPSGEWNYIIRNQPFIFSEEAKLEKIPLVCFPGASFLTEFGKGNTLINRSLYNSFSTETIKWLKGFDVKEPSEIAYLEKEIIGKIDTAVNEQNYQEITLFIFKLHISKKLKEIHYTKLRDLPLKTKSGMVKAKNCYLSSAYNPVIDFAKYINELNIVSEVYIGSYNPYEWRTFFVSIDVADDINLISNYEIKYSDKDFDSKYFDEAVVFAMEGHTYPHLVKNTYSAFISYFTFFVKATQLNYSVIFWNRLITKYTLLTEGRKTLRGNYDSGKEATLYKLDSFTFKSLDQMRWGYFESNRTYIPAFFFWFLRNKNCIPTNQKSCLKAPDVFANSENIQELAGNYLPIIKVEKELSNDWIQLLGLKTKLSLTDYLSILKSINSDLTEKKLIKKENEKRLGLLYNELIDCLKNLTPNEEKQISDWAKKNSFVCKDLVPRKASEVVWLKVEGFDDYNEKMPSLLIPQNVVVDDKVEKLISLFGIQVIDQCEYKIIDEKQDIKLTIKILELLPALALILKIRLKIRSEEDYMKRIFNSLENFNFYACKEILLILNYGEVEIKGSNVKYHLSKERLYYTKNWQSPLERYHISKYLGICLEAQRLEQEIQLLLELTNEHAKEYLDSLNLSINSISLLPIYQDIADKIKEFKESLITITPTKAIEPVLPPIKNTEPKPAIIVDPISPADTYSSPNTILSHDEISQLEELFHVTLSEDQMHDENLAAHIKALFYFQSKGYDISMAKLNFKENLEHKYLKPIISPEGEELTVMCRSARSGLLFLGAYAWLQLGHTNTWLYVLTGSEYSKCKICYNHEHLSDSKSGYWIFRREVDEDYNNIGNILYSDNDMQKMQLIYRVNEDEYKLIFEEFITKEAPVRTGGVIDDER